MDSERGPGGGCDACSCNGTDRIVDVDTEFFTLVMGCTIASFLGFFGSVYVLLSNVGVIVRLQAKLRHQLWHYLLNGGFLIILMAIGEGTLGFFLYRASINSALHGAYWGLKEEFADECYTQARVIQFAVWLEMICVLLLGASFYDILENRRNVTPRLCAIYIGSSILGAGVMTIIPSAAGSFGALKMWCWVTANSSDANATDEAANLQWGFYYAEVFVAVIVLTVITAVPLRRWSSIRRDANKRQLAVRMILFPAVWLLCKMPAVIDRAYQLFTGGDHLFGLTLVHAVTIPTMGFADAIAYACTSAKMQEFFTSLKFRVATNRKLRKTLLDRGSLRSQQRQRPESTGARATTTGTAVGEEGKRVVSTSVLSGGGGSAERSRLSAAKRKQPRNRPASNSARLQPSTAQQVVRELDVEDLLERIVIDSKQVEIQELVGHGSTGQIYKGKYQGKIVALRERFESRDGRAGAGLFQRVMQEASTMMFVRHPYIVNFFGLWDQPCDVVTRTFLVLEYCEYQLPRRLEALRAERSQLDEEDFLGSSSSAGAREDELGGKAFLSRDRRQSSIAWLKSLFVAGGDASADSARTRAVPLKERQSSSGPRWLVEPALKLKWTRQIADAFKYLSPRTPALVHGALRPSKVLLTASDDVRITDFSCAFSHEKQLVEAGTRVSDSSWDARFLPPDILRALNGTTTTRSHSNTSSASSQVHTCSLSISAADGMAWDVYAFAMTMFFIWAERMPFSLYIDPRHPPVVAGTGSVVGEERIGVDDGGDRCRNGAAAIGEPPPDHGGECGDEQVLHHHHHRVRSGTEATVVGLIAPHDSVVGLGSELASSIQQVDLRPDLSTLQGLHARGPAPTANGGSPSPNFSGVAHLLEQLWVADRDERPAFEQVVAMLKDGENLVRHALGGASSV